jgi:flagellar biosynthesis protein FlhF
VEELAGCHVVLVDTAGRNPRAPGEVLELGRLLDGAPSAEKHLVLSATTKHEDLCAAVQAFGALVVDRLVVTRLDETCTVGSVLNLLAEHPGLPPTFFGTGQQVPGDLVPATAGYLVGRVLGTVSPQP